MIASFAQTPILTLIADGDCVGGNPKVIEIYASGTVDFANYTLQNQTNANTTWGASQDLSALGVITNDFVYVYYEGNTGAGTFAAEFPSAVNTLVSSTVNFNGDDRVRIIETATSNVVDQFGVTDLDGTGETWEYIDGYGRRNNGTGPDGAFVEANWTIGKLAFDNLGLCQGGADPFEVISGAGTYTNSIMPQVSFQTSVFTFNEGAGTVHLDSLLINPALVAPTMADQFEIHLKSSSTASILDFDVTGLPIPIVFPQTVPLGLFNFTAQALDVTIIDDALVEGSEFFILVLRNATGGISIGADSTLRVNIIDNDFPLDTFVELTSNSITVNEGDGSFDINLDYQQNATNPNHTVDLILVSGNAADIDNFTTMTATFSTITQKFTVNITDDLLIENDEVFTFALANATNGLFIGPDSIFTLTIIDNDIPTYDLGLVGANNANGADSAGLYGKFIGVVNSLDRAYVGSEFSIQSATGALDVFSNVAPFSNLAPAVGDELEIEGTIKFFNGMVRIENLVSVTTLSTGNVVIPELATAVTDANESRLIRINGLRLINPAQWNGDNLTSGFDVHTLNAAGDTVMLRIDRDYAALYASAAPNSAMIDVVGVASQYDPTAPYDRFHQLIPRDLNDIILYPTLNFAEQGSSVDEDAGSVIIVLNVANDNGGSYTVDVALTGGNGTAADIDNFTTLTGVAITGGTGSFTVNITDDTEIEGNENLIFTVSNPSPGLLIGNGNTYDLTIIDNDADGILDINVNDLKVYPNPASHTLKIDFISNETQLSTVRIVDMLGRVVSAQTVLLNFGQNNLSFDVSNLAKGNYAVEIATEAGKHAINIQVK